MEKEIKFYENLRFLRQSRKMTQSALAKLLGVDQRTVSTWEKGICEPSFTMLAKICDIFDESFDNILT
ncbi:MAG: helix-turn-helix domain-containing protein [Clostridia bacterium]|nr:helix-turn-helix domain-containing protein [Clostridia bacterium]MDE7182740.1 helix-turn-helix domain-containing protein [Clostridia bacterium]